VFTDTVFLNGLYNGALGESHRAKILSRNNLKMSAPGNEGSMTNHRFGLNVQGGYVYEKFNVKGYNAEHRTFAHRYFNRIIVSMFILNATPTADPAGITIDIKPVAGSASSDIVWGSSEPFNSNYTTGATVQCGETVELEDPRYQTSKPTVCVTVSAIPQSVQLNPNSNVLIYYLASYDFTKEESAAEFESALEYYYTEENADLFILHEAAWQTVWNDGRIEVDGDLELQKVLYGALYYIQSSLPVTTSPNAPLHQFYGLSPGGLAYGGLLMDYQGHSFWDTETWMYPSILYLYPRAAEQILSYRLAVIQAARDLAVDSGFCGARFPWEGAVTGREVTPDCCVDTRELQIHITADISYAVRQYIAATRDFNWLRNKKPGYIASGCEMIREMAEFYTCRAVFNMTTRFTDIRGVMPPDEDNRPVDNNPYTNIGAGYAIFFAKYAECLCNGNMQPVPQAWLDLASSLKLLYDETNDYHPEFEGYQFGTEIKQADVVLIGFPQQYDMPASTRRNDLLIYENVTRSDGPAMTWAMHTIGFLDLEDEEKAGEMFQRSYKPYVREPFKIWTEAQPPTLGAINFITGMGGFLQSVISGYGGYRLYPEKIVFKKPKLPPGTTELRVRGLDYLGSQFDLTVRKDMFFVTLTRRNAAQPLVAVYNGIEYPFTQLGISIGFQLLRMQSVEIRAETPTQCPLPLDKIGTPRPEVLLS
jgi:trehalose/maltose hydrolase-like predicted phosphorylase